MTDDDRQAREQFEEQLSAYLDGELDAKTHARVEAHLAASPEAAETLEELRRVRALVGGLPRAQAPADLGESVIGRLERHTLFAGTETMPTRPATPPGVLSFGRILGAAAVLMIAVLAGYLAISTDRRATQPPVQMADADKQIERVEQPAKGKHRERPEVAKAQPTEAFELAEAKEAPRPEGPAPSRQMARTAAPMQELGAKETEESRSKQRVLRPGSEDMRSAAPRVPAAQVERADEKDAVAGEERRRGGAAGPAQVVRARGVPHEPSLSVHDQAAPGRPVDKEEAAPIRLEERLKTGVTVGELVARPIQDEPVRLTLETPNPGEQTDLGWAMRAFFARNNVQDASSLGASAKVGEGESFFYGMPSASKLASTPEQFVFRGRPQQVTWLVEDLSRSAGQDVRVVLATPDIRAKGWDAARTAASMLSGKRQAFAKLETKAMPLPARMAAKAPVRGQEISTPQAPASRPADERQQWRAGKKGGIPPKPELGERHAALEAEGPPLAEGARRPQQERLNSLRPLGYVAQSRPEGAPPSAAGQSLKLADTEPAATTLSTPAEPAEKSWRTIREALSDVFRKRAAKQSPSSVAADRSAATQQVELVTVVITVRSTEGPARSDR